ncbi:MAG: LPS export ABC transporter periplasmic protein LptC [Verrucomicrobiae bacterium]|nr:LPS export ABC transporter periplasmic protein LptC [Verrucomicrobiae bacterium]
MRQWHFISAVVAVLAWAGHAQTNAPGLAVSAPRPPATPIRSDPGTVHGFKVPEYDAKGQLVWQMFGDRARLELASGKVEVEQMRLELFRGGQVDTTMRSPKCLFDRAAKTASSDQPVEIVATNMVMTGKGFDWNAAESRMRIHNDVTVTIYGRKGMAITMPGGKRQP